ncbi:hypothetical protein, partial [Escherichia coli]|uniref:hypothetical protein n=1 Tax=Escherichia coli TaxID=562 RepID=UPI0031B56B02
WQPEFTDKTLSRKPGAVQVVDDGFSVREVTVKHGIPAFGTVCNWLEKYRKYIAKMLSFEKIKIVFLCRIKAPFQHHHYQH